MRGSDGMQESLLTVAKLEDFGPADHPPCGIRALVNEALVKLNSLFNSIYADTDRESIASEKLIRALLLQVTSIRSARSSSWSSNCVTTCCSAGSSAWQATTGSKTTRCSPTTAADCSPTKSSNPSLPK